VEESAENSEERVGDSFGRLSMTSWITRHRNSGNVALETLDSSRNRLKVRDEIRSDLLWKFRGVSLGLSTLVGVELLMKLIRVRLTVLSRFV
jgi:hypothetical protein